MGSIGDWNARRWHAKESGKAYAEGVNTALNNRLEAKRADICREAAREFGDDIHDRVAGLLDRIGNFERLHDARSCCIWSKTEEELLNDLSSIIEHDEPYEQLLNDPRMVASILRVLAALEMLPADCVERLDLENMTLIPTERTGSKFQKEHLSVVWRVPVRGGSEPPIFLLIQYQPESNSETQIHFSEYVTQISAILGVQEDPKPEEWLPRVLPVVIDDEDGEWGSIGAEPGSVAEQIEAVAGTIRYLVLTIGSYRFEKLPDDEPMTWWIRARSAEWVSELQAALRGAGRTMSGEEFSDAREAFVQMVTNLELERGEEPPPPDALRAIVNGEWEDADDIAKWGTKRWYKHAQDGALKEGLEAQRTMLRSQASQRFGEEVAGHLSDSLARINDFDQMTEVANLIVACETGEELLTQINGSE